MTLQKKIFDFFLFASLFIALCAMIMVNQTYILLIQKPADLHYLAFVFFSTVCSYNFHWMLSTRSVKPSFRINWSVEHKGYHRLLFLTGLIMSVILFLYFKNVWRWIGLSVLLTFLYSASKIPFKPFLLFKKFTILKTIHLAFVWTFVTTLLPLIIEKIPLGTKVVFYGCGQFFFIFSLCILFDYRDKEDDKAEGVHSMITYFDEKGLNILFTISLFLCTIFFSFLLFKHITPIVVFILLIPVFLLATLFNKTKRNFSDYFYYFILDGLLMLSGILLWIMQWF